MWNSPHCLNERGKKYDLADLPALTLTLDEILDLSTYRPIGDFVEERILQRLDRGELIFALYEVFEALLGDAPIPEGGHTGIHEALIAEMLSHSFGRVSCEVAMSDFGTENRKAVWQSIDRLLIHRNPYEPELPWILQGTGIKLTDPVPYLSDKMTLEIWDDLLCGSDFLTNEFLWDDDWRMDSLMDLPPDTAKMVTEMAGIDLNVVQALPHSPSETELQQAEEYLWGLVRQSDKVVPVEKLEVPEDDDDDIPF